MSLGPLPKMKPGGGLASLGALPSLKGMSDSPKPAGGSEKKFGLSSDKRITGKRIAVRWNPPVIALEYTDNVSDKPKLKLFPVDLPKGNEEARKIAASLAQRHPLFLAKSIIKTEQLTKVVIKLLSNRNKKGKDSPLFFDENGMPVTNATPSSNLAGSPNGKSNTNGQTWGSNGNNSNSLTNSGGSNASGHSSLTSLSALTSAADSRPTSSNGRLDFGSTGSSTGIGTGSATSGTSQSSAGASVDEEIAEDIPVFLPGEEDEQDFNRLSHADLMDKKREMEKDFTKNQVKPGQAGYRYDKQEEFNPQAPSEWDEFST